ncbi:MULTISPECIES: hypothetical protein [Curtobacterium]|uniref:hypothetical protein n=1 Tax=Curtobacterium TaxID=2034 RepID=UPI000A65E5CF|nr:MULTISPECIES: hypothetical protein [Curtobacterium]UBQ03761.1 hypothetical protein LCG91_06265 [Curtobacterium sp. TXMA1]
MSSKISVANRGEIALHASRVAPSSGAVVPEVAVGDAVGRSAIPASQQVDAADLLVVLQ